MKTGPAYMVQLGTYLVRVVKGGETRAVSHEGKKVSTQLTLWTMTLLSPITPTRLGG